MLFAVVAAEMEPHRVYAEEGCSEQDQAHEGGTLTTVCKTWVRCAISDNSSNVSKLLQTRRK